MRTPFFSFVLAAIASLANLNAFTALAPLAVFSVCVLPFSSLSASDERLALMLSSGISKERLSAAYLLGMSKDPGAVGLLLNQLHEEPVKDNQLVMIESLRKLATKEGYEGLSRFYQISLDGDVQRKVVQVLGESGEGCYAALIAQSVSSSDQRDQDQGIAALSQIRDTQASRALIQYLFSQHLQSQRDKVLSAIAAQKRNEAVSPLIQFGNQSTELSEKVRVAEALAEIGDYRAQEAVLSWFLEAQEYASKRRLVRSIKKVGGSSMIEPLFNALKGSDISLQKEIVDALISIDADAAAPYLHTFYRQSMKSLDPHLPRLEALALIRFQNFLRRFLSIEDNFFDLYPDEWRNDPILHHLIAVSF